jgi:hypothetical protein
MDSEAGLGVKTGTALKQTARIRFMKIGYYIICLSFVATASVSANMLAPALDQ